MRFARLLMAALLCLVMCTCASEEPVALTKPGHGYAGTWLLADMGGTGGGESEALFAALDRCEGVASLELVGNGTGTLNAFGKLFKCTWATSDDGATFTYGDAVMELEIDGDVLTVRDGSNWIAFERVIENADDEGDEDGTEGLADVSERIDKREEGTEVDSGLDALDGAVALSRVLYEADDLDIELVGKGLYFGRPAIVFSFANKADADMEVGCIRGSWTADQVPAYANILQGEVAAGETAAIAVQIEAVGVDVASLTHFAGTFSVCTVGESTTVQTVYVEF